MQTNIQRSNKSLRYQHLSIPRISKLTEIYISRSIDVENVGMRTFDLNKTTMLTILDKFTLDFPLVMRCFIIGIRRNSR